jgi:hypothetical protein
MVQRTDHEGGPFGAIQLLGMLRTDLLSEKCLIGGQAAYGGQIILKRAPGVLKAKVRQTHLPWVGEPEEVCHLKMWGWACWQRRQPVRTLGSRRCRTL